MLGNIGKTLGKIGNEKVKLGNIGMEIGKIGKLGLGKLGNWENWAYLHRCQEQLRVQKQ